MGYSLSSSTGLCRGLYRGLRWGLLGGYKEFRLQLFWCRLVGRGYCCDMFTTCERLHTCKCRINVNTNPTSYASIQHKQSLAFGHLVSNRLDCNSDRTLRVEIAETTPRTLRNLLFDAPAVKRLEIQANNMGSCFL